MINRVVGEDRYEFLRVQRRIYSARFYFTRQQFLYEYSLYPDKISSYFRMYIDYPEMAALTGVYPKTDQSHGFPNPLTLEAYRDFQENTPNTDV